MKLLQSPEADAEVEQAVAFYEQQRPGLGLAFLTELRHGYQAVVAHPQRWPTFSRRTRRYRLHRFPYYLVYTEQGDQLLVLAVMHAARRPGYWQDRLP